MFSLTLIDTVEVYSVFGDSSYSLDGVFVGEDRANVIAKRITLPQSIVLVVISELKPLEREFRALVA